MKSTLTIQTEAHDAGVGELRDETEQVRRCQAGDALAWSGLVTLVRPLVHTIARRDFRLSLDDVEDIHQLVCLKLYENLGQLREPAAFRQWLRCLTRRVIVDFLRQRKETASLDFLEESFGLEPTESTADLRWVDRATLRVEVERALLSLPEKYRGPVLMHLLEGEPQEEVSRRLGRPRSTVASQIHRGLARLRRSLAAADYV